MKDVAREIFDACEHLDGDREFGECNVKGTRIGSEVDPQASVRMFLQRKPEIHPMVRELEFTVPNVKNIHEREGETGMKNLLIEGEDKSIIVNEDGDVNVR